MGKSGLRKTARGITEKRNRHCCGEDKFDYSFLLHCKILAGRTLIWGIVPVPLEMSFPFDFEPVVAFGLISPPVLGNRQLQTALYRVIAQSPKDTR